MKLPQIEVSVRIKNKGVEKHRIQCSNDIYQLSKLMFNQGTIEWTEEAIIMCMNRNNELIGFKCISSGGMAGTVIDPKVVFTIALQCSAHSVILMHNHPSGNLKTSQADDIVTNKLVEAGRMLEIQVLDHIIVTTESYYSYADNGRI
jgi:DNA repair protein RadC